VASTADVFFRVLWDSLNTAQNCHEKNRGSVLLCNTEICSGNYFCRAKAIPITYSDCVFVALFIRRAMRMLHRMLSSVASLPLACFPTLSHELHEFRRKK
jgi:hypothetical protein